MIVALDFDGVVVKHTDPLGLEPVLGALPGLRELQGLGCEIALWTCRDGEDFEYARNYLEKRGIQLLGHKGHFGSVTDSPKIYCDLYLDDRAVGAPLLPDGNLDWRAALVQIRARMR